MSKFGHMHILISMIFHKFRLIVKSTMKLGASLNQLYEGHHRMFLKYRYGLYLFTNINKYKNKSSNCFGKKPLQNV